MFHDNGKSRPACLLLHYAKTWMINPCISKGHLTNGTLISLYHVLPRERVQDLKQWTITLYISQPKALKFVPLSKLTIRRKTSDFFETDDFFEMTIRWRKKTSNFVIHPKIWKFEYLTFQTPHHCCPQNTHHLLLPKTLSKKEEEDGT